MWRRMQELERQLSGTETELLGLKVTLRNAVALIMRIDRAVESETLDQTEQLARIGRAVEKLMRMGPIKREVRRVNGWHC